MATDIGRDLTKLYATISGARFARELVLDLGAVAAGNLMEGYLTGLRLGLLETAGARAAYETIQRAADAAAPAAIEANERARP